MPVENSIGPEKQMEMPQQAIEVQILEPGIARDISDPKPFNADVENMVQARSASSGCRSGSSRCGQSRSSHIDLEAA